MGLSMSRLVDRAIDAAGLSGVAAARRAGTITAADMARLRDADLLALGALADRVRRDEVGEEVRIYPSFQDDSQSSGQAHSATIVLPSADHELTGLELLREVAIARVTGPYAAAVRVDWTSCGLELAQVSLGFGANELAGQITSKRGLPLADGELIGVGKRSRWELAQTQKKRELAALVRRAGREPVFAERNEFAVTTNESTPRQEAEVG
jgi:2-iminoacetate synthase ThiH